MIEINFLIKYYALFGHIFPTCPSSDYNFARKVSDILYEKLKLFRPDNLMDLTDFFQYPLNYPAETIYFFLKNDI